VNIYKGKSTNQTPLSSLDHRWSIDDTISYIAYNYGQGQYTLGWNDNSKPKRKTIFLNEFTTPEHAAKYQDILEKKGYNKPKAGPVYMNENTYGMSGKDFTEYLKTVLHDKLDSIEKKLSDILEITLEILENEPEIEKDEGFSGLAEMVNIANSFKTAGIDNLKKPQQAESTDSEYLKWKREQQATE